MASLRMTVGCWACAALVCQRSLNGWRGEINLILLDSRVRGNDVGGGGLVGISMTGGV